MMGLGKGKSTSTLIVFYCHFRINSSYCPAPCRWLYFLPASCPFFLSIFPQQPLSLSLSILLTFCCISLSRHTWISFFINTDLVLFTLTLRITLIYKRIHFLVLMSWFLSLSDKEETYSKWSNCITVNKILSSKRFSLLLKVIVRIQVNSKYLEEKKIFLFPFSPHLCCCCSLCSYLFDPNPWHSDRCFMAQKKEINMSAKVTEIYDLIFRYFSLDI